MKWGLWIALPDCFPILTWCVELTWNIFRKEFSGLHIRLWDGSRTVSTAFFYPPPARTAPLPSCRAPANVNSVVYCLSVTACEGWPTFPSLPAQPVWEGKEKECCYCGCFLSEMFTSPCFNSRPVFKARNKLLTASSHISHYFQEVRVSGAEKVTKLHHLPQSDVQNLNLSVCHWLRYGNFKV